MSERISSQGTLVKVKIGSPLAFTLIDGLSDFTRSGGTKTTLDGTALSDTAPVAVGGFPSAIEWNGTCFYDPADTTHIALKAAFDAATQLTFQVTLPADTPIVKYFLGEITDFGNYTLTRDSIVSCAIKVVQNGADSDTEPV